MNGIALKDNYKKRAYERIPVHLLVKFFCNDTHYTGTVTNLSEKGMFINTKMCFPFDSEFEVLISSKKEVLRVPVKVNRIIKTNDTYDGMSVELMKSIPNYLVFVNGLRSVM